MTDGTYIKALIVAVLFHAIASLILNGISNNKLATKFNFMPIFSRAYASYFAYLISINSFKSKELYYVIMILSWRLSGYASIALLFYCAFTGPFGG